MTNKFLLTSAVTALSGLANDQWTGSAAGIRQKAQKCLSFAR